MPVVSNDSGILTHIYMYLCCMLVYVKYISHCELQSKLFEKHRTLVPSILNSTTKV